MSASTGAIAAVKDGTGAAAAGQEGGGRQRPSTQADLANLKFFANIPPGHRGHGRQGAGADPGGRLQLMLGVRRGREAPSPVCGRA